MYAWRMEPHLFWVFFCKGLVVGTWGILTENYKAKKKAKRLAEEIAARKIRLSLIRPHSSKPAPMLQHLPSESVH